MEDLKQKTINGISWSFIDGFLGQGLYFIVGIILARILSPREFGLIGMTTIFVAISQTFIDSGFSSALIRKKDCTTIDFSTVFYFNLIVSVFFTLGLFCSAGVISNYFKEHELEKIIKVLSFGIILNGLSSVQQIIFSKKLDFKTQTKISITSSVVSGIAAISSASMGLGVWSLVVFTLSKYLVSTSLYWIFSTWRPEFIFNMKSFYSLFGFGSRILVSTLLNTIYEQIYFIIIGKYYNASALGQYTRADQFKALPSQQLTSIISKVSYPVFSKLQDDISELRQSFIRVVRITMFFAFLLMFGLAAISSNLVLFLLNPQWEQSITYLQMLCFVGVLYPLHALNLNILLVRGRSDLFLRVEVFKKVLGIPVIMLAVFFSINYMIIGMIILSVIAYFVNAFYTGVLLEYKLTKQIKDIFPSFILGAGIGIIIYLLGIFLKFGPFCNLLLQGGTGILLFVLIGELKLSADYTYLKDQISTRVNLFKNKRI